MGGWIVAGDKRIPSKRAGASTGRLNLADVDACGIFDPEFDNDEPRNEY
jgi:hypothetical protein